jgi:pyridoxal/pyridoxine/pyridoxamine kinase
MFDLGFIVSALNKAELKYGISHADIIIGNDYEIAILKQKLSDWKKILKDKTLITTLGEKGAWIQAKRKTIFVKVALPKKLVDPTGAGDAWRAGFLAGLDKGFDLQTSGLVSFNPRAERLHVVFYSRGRTHKDETRPRRILAWTHHPDCPWLVSGPHGRKF